MSDAPHPAGSHSGLRALAVAARTVTVCSDEKVRGFTATEGQRAFWREAPGYRNPRSRPSAISKQRPGKTVLPLADALAALSPRHLVSRELVEGVLIGGGDPEFHHLAVAHMEDLRLVELDAPAAPASREDHQSHAVLVVREDRMKVSAEGSFRELHELAEEPEDRLPPAVVTRYLIPPAFVPQHVLGEEVLEDGESPLAKAA